MSRITRWEKSKTILLLRGGWLLHLGEIAAEIDTTERITPAYKKRIGEQHKATHMYILQSGYSNDRFGGSFSSLRRTSRYVLNSGKWVLQDSTDRKTNK